MEDAVSFSALVLLATRRWYLVVTGVLVSFGLAFLASLQVSPQYTTVANVVLIPPPTIVGDARNPYLTMGGLEAAADVTATSLAGSEVQEEVAALGASSTVVRDANSSAPIIVVTVVAGSAEAAQQGLELLVDNVPRVLTREQATIGVVDRAQLTSRVIATTRSPEVSRSPQLRAVIVVLAASLAFSMGLVALVDRRLRRRGEAISEAASPAPTTSVADARVRVRSAGRGQSTARPGAVVRPPSRLPRPPPAPPPGGSAEAR
ncbi:hypothetical protein ASG49_14625 [Marmoricola sp. Leaf446]|nr:hypothetical protein ASG49_14625 [Marmoricola sp. Leaf446]